MRVTFGLKFIGEALAALALLSQPVSAALPPPSITSISPTAGSTNGGTIVTVSGSNFQNGATVAFGPSNATLVTFVNSTTLKATTPAHPQEGVVGVFVTNPDGQSASLPSSYTYHLPPSISSVSPTNGPPAGGITVVITGSYFRTGAKVLFGTTQSTSVIFDNNTQLRAVSPAHAPGLVSVTVTNPDGQSATLQSAFTYNLALTLASVSPTIGPTAGGTKVTLKGTYFFSTSKVSFGGLAASSITFVSSTMLTAVAPAHFAAKVDVTVTNPSGEKATLSNAYEYSSNPIVYSLNPNEGLPPGGTTVTLKGAELKAVDKVLFGGVAATIKSTSPSQVVVVTPPYLKGGPVDVVVKTPYSSLTIPQGFDYTMIILTNGLDDGYPNIPYHAALTAYGGKLPYTWSVSAGHLPNGLALNSSTGILSGLPGTTYGTYTVTIQVTDSNKPALVSTKVFTFNILFGFQPGPIPSTFFGMIVYNQFNWPSVSVGALGKGLSTTWPFIEQNKGVYNWTVLDEYVLQAQSHNVTLYWTNANVPPWAAADKNSCSHYPGSNIYACTSMVSNIADFDTFMTALVTRYKGKIQFYELWNEPNVANVYTGTMTDLVTLTMHAYNDIRATDPAAQISSPSPTSAGFLQDYFNAGGPKGVDAIAIHGYPDVGYADVPEAIVGFKSVNTKSVMVQLGLQNKPIWDTESSWGGVGSITDPDLRTGFVARSYLLHWSVGIPRFYWYAWDSTTWGTLWTPTGITPAGVAYQQVFNWMVGATMPSPCSENGGTTYTAVYTCDLTRTGGYLGRAVWDTTQTCNKGSCTTSPYTPDPMFIQYRDLQGNVHPISPGQIVQIGAKPILLEN